MFSSGYRERYIHEVMSGDAWGFKPALHRAWLQLGSVFYGAARGLRNSLYNWGVLHEKQAPIPVISVGKITLGGTAKTSMVEYLCRRLAASGLRVAVLSQGYGARPGTENDETDVLARHLPDGVVKLSGVDLEELARRAAREYRVDVAVLDDGFQSRTLARDLDIVVIDALNPFGYGHGFPRGLLRESLRELHRADLFIVTGADVAEQWALSRARMRLSALQPLVPVMLAGLTVGYVGNLADQTQANVSTLAGRAVFVFCGIGNPAGFAATLAQNNIEPVGWSVFPDHHTYTAEDLTCLAMDAQDCGANMILTTEKDAVKLPEGFVRRQHIHWVRVWTNIIEGQEELDRLLFRVGKTNTP